MAKKMDKIKKEIIGEVLSSAELENCLFKYDFVPVEDEEDEQNDNVIKFTNYRSQIWIESEIDEDGNILITDVKNIARLYNEPTRVEPFRSYEDLKKILDYFKDNQMYHHWFTSCLMVSLGRRIGDTIALKWSDLFLANGEYRERLTTLKEEKTGKVVGVKLNALAKFYINEYCKLVNIQPMQHYKERIFCNTTAAFRKALKQGIKVSGLLYPISTHSFRKYYANTIYRLHPQDSDNLMIIQTMLGHSDLETTKIYINEIDRKSDKYNSDYADYMLKMKDGEKFEISNSPVITLEAKDFRELLSQCWDLSQNGLDKFDAINKMIGIAESKMI